MLILEGLATSPGISKGKVVKIEAISDEPAIQTVKDIPSELNRVDLAIQSAKEELTVLYEKALNEAGAEVAAIFDIHKTMLEDDDFLDCIQEGIQFEAYSADYSVHLAGQQFSSIFADMEDEYMKERAADVVDLSRRIIGILTGHSFNNQIRFTEPSVIAAEDLLPSQTLQMDKSMVLSFISKRGSMNSHASILARSLGIPAVAALGDNYEQIMTGDFVIVDGSGGRVIHQPNHEMEEEYQRKLELLDQEKLRLRSLIGTKAVTRDGSEVEICANIGHFNDCDQVLEMDADGIGLFRSEFLYLESKEFPNEETQYGAYKKVLERLSPKKVVIRTLDLGADKQAPYFDIGQEENPALGYRAIRISLDRIEIFITQLRALLRASVHGRLAIMFPMITGVPEVRKIYEILDCVKKDLANQGIPYSNEIEYGIMIETPAAVMVADLLAKEVDFFSIGTNDLTQYAMACDRMNSKISYLFDSGNIAILRMIHQTAEAAHQNGIWVGICGESAADLKLIPHYIAMGIEELSVAAPKILMLKEFIQGLDKAACIRNCEEYLLSF